MNDYDVRSAFEEMELELISSMKRNLSRHQKWETKEGINWTMWQAEQLKTLEQYKKQNKKIFTSRFSAINHQITKLLKDTYLISGFEQERAILKQVGFGKGITEPISIKKEWFKIPIQKRSAYNLKDFILKKPTSKGIEGGFFSLNEDKMNALIQATTKDMTKAEYAMLRMADDQYRKIIFDAQVMANSGAFTLSQAIDKATRDFLKAGINCITYKDGKRVNIAAYAEMNIRTATKRAKLISEGEARNAYGIHTVKVSRYGQCSETCIPWQGRVYVDDVYSGGTKEEAERLNLPLLSVAIAGGLFHPNCKHIMTTYFYDLKKSLGKLQEDGAENPPEEQEHRKNQKFIQQQERLATGLLDQQNIQEATMLKNKWLDKDKMLENYYQTKTEDDIINLGDYHYLNDSEVDQLRKTASIITPEEMSQIWQTSSFGGYIQTPNAFDINHYLRTGNIDYLLDPEDDLKTIETLSQVIKKNHTEVDMRVFRMTGNLLDVPLDAHVIRNMLRSAEGCEDLSKVIELAELVGKEITFDGFTSTSYDMSKNVFNSRPVRMEIDIPKGKNIYLTDNDDESEIILDKGSSFIVNECEVSLDNCEIYIHLKMK